MQDMRLKDGRVKTRLQVAEDLVKLKERLAAYRLCPEYTIPDYPIGSQDRGQCRLQVEFKRGHGFRTRRTTTDRSGRWCKPKFSTYRQSVMIVAVERQGGKAGWIEASMTQGVWFLAANGEPTNLCSPPGYSPPRRVPYTYTVHAGPVMQVGADGLRQEDSAAKPEKKEYQFQADPPEVLQAWDLWEQELKLLLTKMTDDARQERQEREAPRSA